MSIEFAVVLSTLGVGSLWGLVLGGKVLILDFHYRRRNAAINKKIDEVFGPGYGPELPPTGRHRLSQGGRHQLRPRHA
jgi:hypothetical protein